MFWSTWKKRSTAPGWNGAPAPIRPGQVKRSSTTVAAWGDNCCGQLNQPEGLNDVAAISAGGHHSLALKRDGTVVGWGNNDSGEASPPSGLSNLVAVSAGQDYSLVLKADGTVFGWGRDDWGKATPPEGLSNVVAISAGSDHSLALRADGTVVTWGRCEYGVCDPPPGLTNVVAIDGGSYHSMALAGSLAPAQQPAPVFVQPAYESGTFSASLQTALGRVYVFEGKNTLSEPRWSMLLLMVGNGGRKTVSDPTAGPQKFYRVRVVP
jgi:hypothetical protein